MRWTPILSIAAMLGGTMAFALPATGAPPAFADAGAYQGDRCPAPQHPMGLHASFPMEPPWGPPPGPGFGHGLEAPLPPYLHGVTLSDEQQDKIFDLMHGQAPQVRQLARALQKTRSQLRDLGLSEKYDEASARALIEAASKTEGELALIRTHTDHEILGLLTPEQRKLALADAANPGGHEHGGVGAIGQGPSCWH